MRPMHRAAIAKALGLRPDDDRVSSIDTAAWSAFPRSRLFFSTLPAAAGVAPPPPDPSPWEEGWRPYTGQ
eukprot:7136322-Alexandrium_andersonii.AAC.1